MIRLAITETSVKMRSGGAAHDEDVSLPGFAPTSSRSGPSPTCPKLDPAIAAERFPPRRHRPTDRLDLAGLSRARFGGSAYGAGWRFRERAGGALARASTDRYQDPPAHPATHQGRACETWLNGLDQCRTTLDGLDIDFLHIRSPEPNALPLLMTHGWPGSVLEYRKVIGPLTNRAAHGGDRADAFHLILPTLPGFGFSANPTETGGTLSRIADAWIALMGRLGYDRWAAQGGDLGCGVTDEIARRAPAGLIGMHLNFAMFGPTPDEIAEATPEERAVLGSAKYFWDNLSGYAKEQSTRPQTIGYSVAHRPRRLDLRHVPGHLWHPRRRRGQLHRRRDAR